MNALDGVVLVAAVAAAFSGWRFGSVARLLAWAGVALGLMIGIHFVPGVVTHFGGVTDDDRVTVALLFLLLAATLGQGFGLAVAALVHRRNGVRGLRLWDRIAGAAIGALGVAIVLWLMIPTFATVQGWPAHAARGSSIVGWVQKFSPEEPTALAAWGRAITKAPYALGPLDNSRNGDIPAASPLSRSTARRVRASVVKVTGIACNVAQYGSGWVAARGLVVTNAHVVTNETMPIVWDEHNRRYEANVVAYNRKLDLAVLEVPGLSARPLTRASGKAHAIGAVYGHPYGRRLVVAPARLNKRAAAVVDKVNRREVYVLTAALREGDSGGPLVNADGNVVGVVFGVAEARPHTAYANTVNEVNGVLSAAEARTPVETGSCTARR